MTAKEAIAQEQLGIVSESSDVFGKRAKTFDRIVDEIAAAQQLKKQTEATIRELQVRLETFFADSPSKTVLSEGRRVTLVMSSNSHLDKKMLIERGVPAQTLLDCTKVINYSFVKVTTAKETQ